MPDDLLLFLTLSICVQARNDLATCYGLRMVAIKLDEDEAVRFTQTLSNALDSGDRFWFRNILGPRPEALPIEPGPGGKTQAGELAIA